MTEFKGTALVTGAARGIGRAIAARFLSEGWRVGLLDNDAATLHATVEALSQDFLKDAVIGLEADVSDEEAVQHAVAAFLPDDQSLDVLVNNAGVAVFRPIAETPISEWRRILDVNLTGPFVCALACLPHLNDGGAIVNIGSISGLRASTYRAAYGTSKAGLAHLTKQMAVELSERGIRVNLIAPGPVETNMAKLVHTPEIRKDYNDAIPLARYGLTDEIAEAVFFLATPSSAYITGQTLAVDGGFDAAGVGLPGLRKRTVEDE